MPRDDRRRLRSENFELAIVQARALATNLEQLRWVSSALMVKELLIGLETERDLERGQLLLEGNHDGNAHA